LPEHLPVPVSRDRSFGGEIQAAHRYWWEITPKGLGFLRNSVIDQHLLRRNRQFDLVTIIKTNPQLIGIGLDESTAILVQKDTLVVLGKIVHRYLRLQNNSGRRSKTCSWR